MIITIQKFLKIFFYKKKVGYYIISKLLFCISYKKFKNIFIKLKIYFAFLT